VRKVASGKTHIIDHRKTRKTAPRTHSRKKRSAPLPPVEKLWLNTTDHTRDSLTKVIRRFHSLPRRTPATCRDFRAELYAFSVLLSYWGLDQRAKENDIADRLTELEKVVKERGL
jgi:hypothetical protein